MVTSPAVVVKKRLPIWAKVLIGIAALAGLGVTGYAVFIFWVLLSLGNAGTEYNEVVSNEAARVESSLGMAGCTKERGGESSHGNLDAIEKYSYEYTCSSAAPALGEQFAGKMSTLGYKKSEQEGIYTNDCCQIQYQASASGYAVGLYSNKVDGMERQ